jgi:hypothetical protein
MATAHSPLKSTPLGDVHPPCKTAALVYKHSVESANALWAAYDLARVSRGKPRGITTDQEQDILRAMLIAAASGLDATLKQLLRECLPLLLKKTAELIQAFEKFSQRHLQGGEVDISAVSAKALARLLISDNPQKQLVEHYVYELTGDSLQSTDQLHKACAALGVESKAILGDLKTLRAIFDARNQMIHELDMKLGSANRKRRVRSQADMKGFTERLLSISGAIVIEVNGRVVA